MLVQWFIVCFVFFFFFQAEDGIRDLTVTGVQTCALPIFRPVVLDRSAADGALGAQGPGPATAHATLRYGEDVRADGRVGREHRPARAFGGAGFGGARLKLLRAPPVLRSA